MYKKICPICRKIIAFNSYIDFSDHIAKEAEQVDKANKEAAEKQAKIEAQKKVQEEKRKAQEAAKKKAAAEKENKRIEDLNNIRKYYEALKKEIETYNKTYEGESISISMKHTGKDTTPDTSKRLGAAEKKRWNWADIYRYWDDFDDLFYWI